MKIFGEEIGEKNRVLNLRKDKEDLRDYSYKLVIEDKIKMKNELAELPVGVDHSKNMSPVKSQKNNATIFCLFLL